MKAHGRKKSFHERSLTSSRVRTGKKGRKSPRRKPVREYSETARSKATTGRIDYDENRHKVVTTI